MAPGSLSESLQAKGDLTDAVTDAVTDAEKVIQDAETVTREYKESGFLNGDWGAAPPEKKRACDRVVSRLKVVDGLVAECRAVVASARRFQDEGHLAATRRLAVVDDLFAEGRDLSATGRRLQDEAVEDHVGGERGPSGWSGRDAIWALKAQVGELTGAVATLKVRWQALTSMYTAS